MPNESDELDIYNIELSETRPMMLYINHIGGLPIAMGAFLFAVAGICFVTLGYKFTFWAPIAWIAIGRATANDYHAVTKIQRWMETSMWNGFKDAVDHGGTGTTPNPQKPAWVRGMASE